MRPPCSTLFSAFALAIVVSPAIAALPAAAQTAPALAGSALSYADAADLVLSSPVILDATIRSAAKIKGAEAASAAPNTQRFYVTANVAAVLRSPGAMPPTVGYVYDAPLDAGGRPPKLKKLRVLVFARPLASDPGSSPGQAGAQVQLVTGSAQRVWTPSLDALVRRIAGEVVARDAPPIVRGVASAFHVPC